MSNFEDLSTAVVVLKKNREAVSLEELKTRYAASYKQLLEKIKKLSSNYYKECIFEGVLVTDRYFEEYIQYIKTSIAESGYQTEMSNALYQEYDVEKFRNLVERVRNIVSEETQKFYLAHTTIYVPDGIKGLFIDPELCQVYCPVNNRFLVNGCWMEAPKSASAK